MISAYQRLSLEDGMSHGQDFLYEQDDEFLRGVLGVLLHKPQRLYVRKIPCRDPDLKDNLCLRTGFHFIFHFFSFCLSIIVAFPKPCTVFCWYVAGLGPAFLGSRRHNQHVSMQGEGWPLPLWTPLPFWEALVSTACCTVEWIPPSKIPAVMPTRPEPRNAQGVWLRTPNPKQQFPFYVPLSQYNPNPKPYTIAVSILFSIIPI